MAAVGFKRLLTRRYSFVFSVVSSIFRACSMRFISVSVFINVVVLTSASAVASATETDSYTKSAKLFTSADKQNPSLPVKRHDKINVAVAANFAKPLKSIAQQFTQLTGIEVAVTVSSSGTLYAQIQHGAAFDVFLSADRARPQALVNNNLVHESNVVDYAKGKLAFVYTGKLPANANGYESVAREARRTDENQQGGEQKAQAGGQGKPLEGKINAQLSKQLSQQLIQLTETPGSKIAIANPKLAPYGEAAQQTLQNLLLWQHVLPHRVMGKNVLQTLQFYSTGSVRGAFVAYSLALDLPNMSSPTSDKSFADGKGATTVIIPVPENLYQPIVQSLVINAKTAATLSPNVFDAQTETRTPNQAKTSGLTRFDMTKAEGVSSPSLFVQYLLSQGVQHGLAEWGYQPALLDIQPHAERQIKNSANTPVKAASEIGSLTGKAGSLDARGRNRFELNGAHG
ncbi:molybdate ABC transporter substrate-binding protein [Alteromonas mediterranea]|uniref:molybdate ABC transporter substrate-binding protein n=1 Tax=Alteromonas mediterranea TaxID=314275 RepID=UPI0011318322|nr:molybdate ABC transporter substrate-binding protein [Alteromonas mediterranea]